MLIRKWKYSYSYSSFFQSIKGLKHFFWRSPNSSAWGFWRRLDKSNVIVVKLRTDFLNTSHNHKTNRTFVTSADVLDLRIASAARLVTLCWPGQMVSPKQSILFVKTSIFFKLDGFPEFFSSCKHTPVRLMFSFADLDNISMLSEYTST